MLFFIIETYKCIFFLQPAIAGSLGPILNVSAPAAPVLERNDRIQQSLSIGNLVLFVAFLFLIHVYIKIECFGFIHLLILFLFFDLVH